MRNQESVSGQDEMLRYTQQMLAWSAYQESLRESDRKILEQVQASIGSLRAGVWIRAVIHILQIFVVGGALIVATQQAMFGNNNVNLFSLLALGSLVLFGILLYRNPLHSINRTLIDLARVQVILQGYQRQINQVDAFFKQALLEDDINQETLTKSLDQIQRIIDINVESLLQFIEEMSS